MSGHRQLLSWHYWCWLPITLTPLYFADYASIAGNIRRATLLFSTATILLLFADCHYWLFYAAAAATIFIYLFSLFSLHWAAAWFISFRHCRWWLPFSFIFLYFIFAFADIWLSLTPFLLLIRHWWYFSSLITDAAYITLYLLPYFHRFAMLRLLWCFACPCCLRFLDADAGYDSQMPAAAADYWYFASLSSSLPLSSSPILYFAISFRLSYFFLHCAADAFDAMPYAMLFRRYCCRHLMLISLHACFMSTIWLRLMLITLTVRLPRRRMLPRYAAIIARWWCFRHGCWSDFSLYFAPLWCDFQRAAPRRASACRCRWFSRCHSFSPFRCHCH